MPCGVFSLCVERVIFCGCDPCDRVGTDRDNAGTVRSADLPTIRNRHAIVLHVIVCGRHDAIGFSVHFKT